ncbi:MAG: hypothetical protein ACLPYZ_14790 [Limisphaerales bacterium]
MSTAKIEIGYDGEAVSAGSMDVQELAPALLALGELLQESHLLLNDGRGRLRTHVKSDFKKGSFEVNLHLVQDLSDQAAFILEHCKHWSASDICKLVGLSAASGASLIKLVKWLRNRKIKASTVIQNGNVKIETEGDYDSIEVGPEVIRLAKNRKIRMSLSLVLNPLKSIGCDVFFAKDQGKEIERIEKSQLPSFEAPVLPEQQLVDSTREVAVNLIEISFEEGLKWKLFDGENRFNALVLDGEFQNEIKAGKKFSKGDILVVKIRTRQVSAGEGIKNEHEVLKVIKHIPAEQQAELPLESDEPQK